jgi:hypothetical protein
MTYPFVNEARIRRIVRRISSRCLADFNHAGNRSSMLVGA